MKRMIMTINTKRNITFYQVRNGNCCFIEVDGFKMIFDLYGTEEKSSYTLLKDRLRKNQNGTFELDVLCISHGDQDHCGGFSEFAEEMKAGNLVIGSIWHPNFDRTKVADEKDLPTDYLDLHEEIMRRRKIDNQEYGDIEVPLTAWDENEAAFKGLNPPENLTVRVLSPYLKDDENGDLDVNNMSLVINTTISGLSVLFPGDSGSKIWRERIFPHTLKTEERKDWAKSIICIASHHGSYTFFGENREDVLNADPYPDNYRALDSIHPKYLVVSSDEKFPTSKNKSGANPPHYAAWKWYHKWFRKNHGVEESDKHPVQFKYTADGHIRLEYNGSQWEFKNDWTPDDDNDAKAFAPAFIHRDRETKRMGSEYGR